MKRVLFWVVAAVLIVVVSCGKDVVPPKPPPVTERKPTVLILFGAGFCQDCKNSFPVIQKQLAALSEEARKHVQVSVFLVAGDNPSINPTIEMAERYQGKYFPANADGLPAVTPRTDTGWINFKNIMGDIKKAVPAAAISDNEFGIVRRWTAGNTTFSVGEIVAAVKARVGE